MSLSDDELDGLRAYYDYHDTSAEMENGHWELWRTCQNIDGNVYMELPNGPATHVLWLKDTTIAQIVVDRLNDPTSVKVPDTDEPRWRLGGHNWHNLYDMITGEKAHAGFAFNRPLALVVLAALNARQLQA